MSDDVKREYYIHTPYGVVTEADIDIKVINTLLSGRGRTPTTDGDFIAAYSVRGQEAWDQILRIAEIKYADKEWPKQ